MKTVNFTQMKSGTKDEYLLLDKYEKEYIDALIQPLKATKFQDLNILFKQQLELLMIKLVKRWSLQLYYMTLEMN